MPEPATSTAGVAIAAGAVTISGSIFGVQYDTLLAGFFGGLVALSYLPPMPRTKMIFSVVSSSILAGYAGPVVGVAAVHYFPWLESLGDFTRLAAAAGLGVTAQVVVPGALNWLRVKGGAQ